jgi:hypothetical protein
MTHALSHPAVALQSCFGSVLYSQSVVSQAGATFGLLRADQGKQLAVVAPAEDPMVDTFGGTPEPFKDNLMLVRCQCTPANARALRTVLPWLKPALLELRTSAGFGDRLGLATPGHVLALQAVQSPVGRVVAPTFAQQYIREMTRTNRSPEDVLADATWGAFEAGWRGIVGADADHLKTPEDIDRCVQAGFSFFTVDPGQHVDSSADDADPTDLRERAQALPWAVLESSVRDLVTRHVGATIDCDGISVSFNAEAVYRAAVKYGRAIAHVVSLYRHLAAKGIPFELEVSVDEMETPTTPAEHVYIANELKRLGVRWVSLAPRFVGRFEKGVDYIGDLTALAEDLRVHAAIARALGPYKLSLHSGSDKFSMYPLIVQATNGLVHLKTAGTSYLEALRVLAAVQPILFRKILELARERYPVDRATYHVSAELDQVPASATLADGQLPGLLEDFHAREVLHVTFGSALGQYANELKAALRTYEADYYQALKTHFAKHLNPFVGS